MGIELINPIGRDVEVGLTDVYVTTLQKIVKAYKNPKLAGTGADLQKICFILDNFCEFAETFNLFEEKEEGAD